MCTVQLRTETGISFQDGKIEFKRGGVHVSDHYFLPMFSLICDFGENFC